MAQRRPPEPAVNPLRGALLVVVAVVIGLLLLRNGLDTSETVRADGGDRSEDADGGAGDDSEGTDDGTDDGTDPTDTSQPTVRPPAEVTAIVLNGGGVQGAAGRYSDAIGGLGYQMLEPANATSNSDTTQVMYAAGYEAEAAALAQSIQAPSPITPTPLGATPPGAVGAANVVVVLGADLAGTDPPPIVQAGTGTTVTTTG